MTDDENNTYAVRLDKPKTACFIGGGAVPEKCANEVKEALRKVIVSLFNQGITTFLNGGATGFDVLAAEAVISLRVFFKIPVVLAMPPPGEEWGTDTETEAWLVAHSRVCIAYENTVPIAREHGLTVINLAEIIKAGGSRKM